MDKAERWFQQYMGFAMTMAIIEGLVTLCILAER